MMADTASLLTAASGHRADGQYEHSLAAHLELRTAAQAAGDRTAEVAALYGVAQSFQGLHDTRQAQAYAWAVVGLASDSGGAARFATQMVQAYGLLGATYLEDGHGSQGRSCLAKALHLFRNATPAADKTLLREMRVAHLLSRLLREFPQEFQALASEIDLVGMGLA